jgi:electron transfer flavoprotein beta subunit
MRYHSGFVFSGGGAVKIIVPIKQVPETGAVKMDEKTGTMVREGVEAIINPLDLYGLELAIELREKFGGEVTALSMGPPKAETALREAIAMGCDRGVLLSDKAFAGADTWATSYTLATAIAKLGEFDLIICGERATDGDTGQVGPAIASFLGWPVATYISKFEEWRGPTVRVHRLVEDGYEVLDVRLPCVLTVVKEISSPRLPTLGGKIKARQSEIPVWTAESIGADPAKLGLKGSPTRVVKIHKPKVSRQGVKLVAGDEQSAEQAVEALVEFLAGRNLIETVRK